MLIYNVQIQYFKHYEIWVCKLASTCNTCRQHWRFEKDLIKLSLNIDSHSQGDSVNTLTVRALWMKSFSKKKTVDELTKKPSGKSWNASTLQQSVMKEKK